MSTWPLSEIRSRTRLLSGRLSVAEMSNTDLDSYIKAVEAIVNAR